MALFFESSGHCGIVDSLASRTMLMQFHHMHASKPLHQPITTTPHFLFFVLCGVLKISNRKKALGLLRRGPNRHGGRTAGESSGGTDSDGKPGRNHPFLCSQALKLQSEY